jgi:hypothetical protein
MNGPDPARPVDDYLDVDSDDDGGPRYGQPGADLWFSPPMFDGGVPLMPRRPEVTGDGVDALVADLTAWVEWLVATFRLHAKIPRCWVRHPALVEELQALWFLWQHCWLPAADPTMPVAFLRELDASLSRIERHWKVPCDANEHKEPKTPSFRSSGVPVWRAWWSHPDFNDDDRAVAELRVQEHEQP